MGGAWRGVMAWGSLLPVLACLRLQYQPSHFIVRFLLGYSRRIHFGDCKMPGMRDRNLRSGDRNEDLGILLLREIGLVARVPRQEDVGCDAFVTLIRPEGSRRLIPDLSFLVQLKSASVASVAYTSRDEMEWLKALEVPLFIGRVNRKNSSIELFTTQRLHQVLLEMDYEGIELLLDEAPESNIVPEIRRCNLGPPVHVWTISDGDDTAFLTRFHAILRPHVDCLRRNRLLRGIQFQSLLRWETGQPPVEQGHQMQFGPRSDIADTLRSMVPHACRLLAEIGHREQYGDLSVVLALFDLMRRWGVDPDPGGYQRMMTCHMAGGPEISVEDAVRIRLAFQSPGSLNLSGLSVSEGALSLIPDTLTSLALVDAPLSDASVHGLLRLGRLRRVNIAGTKITDEGLMVLAGLSDLEWVCVNRTAVTPLGVDRLVAARPTITVVVGSEPGRA